MRIINGPPVDANALVSTERIDAGELVIGRRCWWANVL